MITTVTLVKIHHHIQLQIFFVMRTLKIYFPNNFQIYKSTVNYSHHGVYYIPRTYLSYNLKFVSFDHFHPFLSLATANLFSMSFGVLDSSYKLDHTVFIFLSLMNFV